MTSLIKWPGGKSREYKNIDSLIPAYRRYIEPFFGGGAIFFQLRPEYALINDISKNLIHFYSFIKSNNNSFKHAIYAYEKYWRILSDYINAVYDKVYNSYIKYRINGLDDNRLTCNINEILNTSIKLFNKLFDEDFTLSNNELLKEISENLRDKLGRMKELEIKKQSPLSDEDIRDNIETGFRSGFYMHFRNIYNDIILNRNHSKKLSQEEKTANFYFIREYCYGSMFRYNASGEFNIPYGGIAYNKKDFKKKVDNLFSSEVIKLLQNTEVYNLDFEEFLNKLKPDEEDFMFLDPPYDTDFSDYESRSFNQGDQERLARFLYNTKGKFILIIKATPFISGLYTDRPGIRVLNFDKQYTYNVRGRNDRDVNHLIITNIEESNGNTGLAWENRTFDW
ncbi:MAG TPA: DNA adenine methylase [Candidatus Eremiobacteraeota bacterium]|nr:DNA adenine methylase [Candidatus Eremiobacteraeota bacterium]